MAQKHGSKEKCSWEREPPQTPQVVGRHRGLQHPGAMVLLRQAGRIAGLPPEHLGLGIEAAERNDLEGARSHFASSIKLQPSAHAHRGLAVLTSNASERQRHYEDAWAAAVAVPKTDPAAHLLRSNIADEIAFSLRMHASDAATTKAAAEASWDALEKMLAAFDDIFGGEEALGATAAGGSISLARASLAFARGDAPRAALRARRLKRRRGD